MGCIIGICDDEISTCSQLENILMQISEKISEKIEIYVWNSGKALITDVSSKTRLDILFLDIEMADYSGIEVGNYIRKDICDMGMNIIYISSKTSYAMELFKIHPYDFLIKPFDKDKIEKLIMEILKLRGLDKSFFTYESHKKSYRLPFGDILYFESDRKHIRIITSNVQVREFTGKLKNIAKTLPFNFAMISQSYIINLRHISECSSGMVVLDNGVELNISRSYKDSFSMKMLEFRQKDF